MMQEKRTRRAPATKTTVKLDPKAHAWLSLIAEKYETTLSGAIYKLISKYEPEIIELQDQIDALKEKHLSE